MFFIPTTSIDSDDELDSNDHNPVQSAAPSTLQSALLSSAPTASNSNLTTAQRRAVDTNHVRPSVRILLRNGSGTGTGSYLHIRPFSARSHSAPPSTSLSSGAYICNPTSSADNQPEFTVDPVVFNLMLAAPAFDLSSFDDSDDWLSPSSRPRLYRTASVGNSWGVTSIGRGFNWSSKPVDDEPIVDEEAPELTNSFLQPEPPQAPRSLIRALANTANSATTSVFTSMSPVKSNAFDEERTSAHPHVFTSEPDSLSDSPISRSPFDSALSLTPASSTPESSSPRLRVDSSSSSLHPPSARSPSAARPRRRSSQQRVSLIAGRLSLVSLDPPSPPPMTSPKLIRLGSQSSFISVTSAAPPSPSHDKESFLGGRSISEFVIEGDIGRGAYGLVKKAREIKEDGTLGVSNLMQ